MKELHHNLRVLNLLIHCTNRDIEKFLENPSEFDAKEYFQDVLEATTEAYKVLIDVRTQIGEIKNATN